MSNEDKQDKVSEGATGQQERRMSSREVKKTEAGREYQIEVLSGEVRRLECSITRQIGLFEEGLPTLSRESALSDLEKLNKTFAELSSVSERLRQLMSEEDATELWRSVKSKGEKVSKVDEEVRKWLKTKLAESPSRRRMDSSAYTFSEVGIKEHARNPEYAEEVTLRSHRSKRERGLDERTCRSEPVKKPRQQREKMVLRQMDSASQRGVYHQQNAPEFDMRSSKSGKLYRFGESQFVYTNNEDTRHIASYAEAALENEVEGLKHQLEETCERIRYEIDGDKKIDK